MNTVVVMPHLDDETFSCGGTLLDHKRIDQIDINIKRLPIPIYQSCTELDSDLFIITFCKGRQNDPNFIDRVQTFKRFCIAVNANYIILNFYDLELYKNPVNFYVDILNSIFNKIDNFDLYIPSENDLHQEHRLVSQCAKISARKYLDKIRQILEFKQPFENFDNTNYDWLHNCTGEKEFCCKQYKETQPLYYDKEYFRIIYDKNAR